MFSGTGPDRQDACIADRPGNGSEDSMKQTWRWFGPYDLVSIDEAMQAGAEGIVSALHHIPNGQVWPSDEIRRRKDEIAHMKDGTPSGMNWEVVESLPVSEDIKKQKGDWRAHIDAYKQSLRNLAAEGLHVVCYSFMPLLGWTRTDTAWRLPNGATCLRFDYMDLAVYDIHLLRRGNAEADYESDVIREAARRFEAMDDDERQRLARNVFFVLPGSTETLSLDAARAHIEEYDSISASRLRQNFVDFLEEVIPLAQELGMRMGCHPDDPSFPLIGLPRIMSTEADYNAILKAVDLPENGITLCSGSLGTRAENDIPGMVKRLGGRIHYAHLRNVRRESETTPCSFHEAGHLDGSTDMVAVVAALLNEEKRRREAGRADNIIAMRADHGQDILGDLDRHTQPGYPAIGRLKGLAELRGVMAALSPGGF